VHLIALVGLAIVVFASTNIDDIFVGASHFSSLLILGECMRPPFGRKRMITSFIIRFRWGRIRRCA
jgi:hypothetical protein